MPDLFQEGQGIVARGELNDKGVFVADEVLAGDENYMPPEVADAIAEAPADAKIVNETATPVDRPLTKS